MTLRTGIRMTALALTALLPIACGGKSRGVVADAPESRLGAIILTGTEKPAGQKVVLDKFLEYNGNGPYSIIGASAGGDAVEVGAVAPDAGTVLPSAVALCGTGANSADALARLSKGNGAWIVDTEADLDVVACVGDSKSPKGTAADSLRAMHARGFVLGGAGIGASAFGLKRSATATSAEAIANRASAALVDGLGLLGDAVVDTHPISRGNLGRLVVAAAEAKVNWGIGVEDNGAALVEPGRGRITAIGESRVVIVDLREADISLSARRFRNVRVSVISPGDVFSMEDGKLRFVSAKSAWGTNVVRAVQDAPEAWTEASLRRALDGVAEANTGIEYAGVSVSGGKTHRAVFTRDAFTMIFKAVKDDAPAETKYTLMKVRLDIEPQENATP